MRDTCHGEKIDVRVSKDCGPYIMFDPTRINEVEELLTRNGIPFRLEDGTNTCLGTPEAAVIEFRRGADAQHIQRVLDDVR